MLTETVTIGLGRDDVAATDVGDTVSPVDSAGLVKLTCPAIAVGLSVWS